MRFNWSTFKIEIIITLTEKSGERKKDKYFLIVAALNYIQAKNLKSNNRSKKKKLYIFYKTSDCTLSKEKEDSKHRKFHILIHINESKSININNSHGVGSLLQCCTITTVIRNKRYASHLLM